MSDSFSGRDLGRRILAGLRAYVARQLADRDATVATLRKDLEETQRHVVAALTPAAGQAQIDAAIGRLPLPEPALTAEDLRPIIDAGVAAAVKAAIVEMAENQPPVPIVEDFRPMLEAYFAKWELDFDRRADAKFERAIDRMPKPKDGEPGQDGSRFQGFKASMDGRMITFSVTVDDVLYEQKVRADFPMERGVYQAGKTYEKSDIVTFAGSYFIATRDVTEKEKPESSPAWRLCVKRGRDGKDLTEVGQ